VTDWIEHDGGPQPVADDVWILAFYRNGEWYISGGLRAEACVWEDVAKYRILNQHLIDAARLEGIRLGLEAAARDVWHTGWHSRPSLVETAEAIRLLDPATIAKEADQ